MSEPNRSDAGQLSLRPIDVRAQAASGKTEAKSPENVESSIFEDDFEFLDDVHGPAHLNRIERDAVDTPEFQRLFRLGQLGFVDLVYAGANHTRGNHSIGVCFWAKQLVTKLNDNGSRLSRANGSAVPPRISRTEKVLISLGALLHDIPHGPFSHDIEKKTHFIYLSGADKEPTKVQSHYGLYEKHDNFKANPALYVFLLDPDRSVLARVLRHYSSGFYDLLLREGTGYAHLHPFLEALAAAKWTDVREELLPQLLFHVLVYDKPSEARNHLLTLRTSFQLDRKRNWGLGPKDHTQALHESWYQPFRHDIIGDTLSADLIDYLMRDQVRLGMKNELDLKLLNHYVLVPQREPGLGAEKPRRYRCAIDLLDHKRGTFRAERLNDLFRLLDLRHQIHEKAVYHRVVQSAIAMLARAGLILEREGQKPSLTELYGLSEVSPAVAGDHHFLELLLAPARQRDSITGKKEKPRLGEHHQTLPCKLAERRVYRPLMVIPGDRVRNLLERIADFDKGTEFALRELAAIVDSTYFSPFFLLISTLIERLLKHAIESEDKVDSLLMDLVDDEERLKRASSLLPPRVIFWTTPYKQLYKDPAILVCVSPDLTTTIDGLQHEESISDSLRSRVTAGLRDAETKNEALWKFYVFISDGLFYTGVLARLLEGHPCAERPEEHEHHLHEAENLVVRALRCAWQYWEAQKKAAPLDQRASPEDLKTIVKLFVGDSAWFQLGGKGIPAAVSAVKVSQYVHGDESPKCRDVRYRFDEPVSLDQLVADMVSDSELREMVKQAIRATGVAVSQIKAEELAELIGHLASRPLELPNIVEELAARGHPNRDQRLKSLWLTDLM